MDQLRRALLAGLAFGLGVAIVDLAFGTWNFVDKNLPAFTGTVLRSSAIQLALGAALGVVTAPLAGRRVAHVLAMTALWLAIARWVLKMNPMMVVGALAGAQTCTPGLNALREVSGSNVGALAYTVPYAVNNILLTLWGPVVVGIVYALR